MLVRKIHHVLEGFFVVFKQDSELVTKDKVACPHSKLLNVSDIGIHLQAELVCCELIVALDVEVFVEEKMIASLVCISSKVIRRLSAKVVAESVLLLNGIILPN